MPLRKLLNLRMIQSLANANANLCFMAPRASSGQAISSLTIESQPESEQFRALVMVEENPKGIIHWDLAVKGERHPRCSMESNPGLVVGLSCDRQMC